MDAPVTKSWVPFQAVFSMNLYDLGLGVFGGEEDPTGSTVYVTRSQADPIAGDSRFPREGWEDQIGESS